MPTFVVIGPGRTGTTMLFEAFKEHPDICMAKNTKETNFFNDEYPRGAEWYASFFAYCEGSNAVGEISNRYIYDPDVPSRIAKCLPSVKLITVLRNPFERILSAYNYRRRSGEIATGVPLEIALERYPDLISQNFYFDQLSRYLEFFSIENLKIIFYDDLVIDPEEFIAEIFDFIGVDKTFVPQAIYRRINPTIASRHRFLSALARLSADALRRWQLYHLLDRAKNSELIKSFLFNKEMPTVSRLSPQLHAQLAVYFMPQIQGIQRITGRSLSHWRNSSDPSQ